MHADVQMRWSGTVQGVPKLLNMEGGQEGGLRRIARTLQQLEEVAVVESSEALQEAVVAGVAHIEIRAHLDLTALDLLDILGGSFILGKVPKTVKSIRVRWYLAVPSRVALSLNISSTERYCTSIAAEYPFSVQVNSQLHVNLCSRATTERALCCGRATHPADIMHVTPADVGSNHSYTGHAIVLHACRVTVTVLRRPSLTPPATPPSAMWYRNNAFCLLMQTS